MAGEANLFYLTGFPLSAGDLWITPEESALFLDDRYLEMVPGSRKALEEENFVRAQAAYKTAINGNLSYHTVLQKKQWVGDVIDFDPVSLCRLIKEEGEIALMQEAAELTRKGVDFAISQLQEGVSEKEIAFAFESFVRKRGADSLSFSPIIAFGPSSSFPHYKAGEGKLTKNSTVLIDVGIQKGGYASDMTRSLCFGDPGEFYQNIVSAVQEVHDRLAATAKAGMLIQELNTLPKKWFQEAGLAEHIRHSIGHFLGIEVHEGYRFATAESQRLEEGMVFTIEPGLYFPGQFGVRIEDAFVVKKEGLERL